MTNYTYVPQSLGYTIVLDDIECFWVTDEANAKLACDELNTLKAEKGNMLRAADSIIAIHYNDSETGSFIDELNHLREENERLSNVIARHGLRRFVKDDKPQQKSKTYSGCMECGKTVEYENSIRYKEFPFCSKDCKQVWMFRND